MKELTGGAGVDYVYDQVAGPRFCRQFDMLATYGQIILYNFLGGYPEDKEIIHILQSRCEGCYGIRYFSIHVHDTDAQGFKQVKRQVLGMMADGSLKPPIHAVLPLAEGTAGSRDDRVGRGSREARAAGGRQRRHPRPGGR